MRREMSLKLDWWILVGLLDYSLWFQALYEAGEKQKGTNTAVFIDIFTSRSGPQLCKGKVWMVKVRLRLLPLTALGWKMLTELKALECPYRHLHVRLLLSHHSPEAVFWLQWSRLGKRSDGRAEGRHRGMLHGTGWGTVTHWLMLILTVCLSNRLLL